MKYAVALYFDKQTDKALYDLAKRVADENLSTKLLEWKMRPHITLAGYNNIDEQACIELLKQFALSHKAIPAKIEAIGMFNDTKVIFASVIMNEKLFQLQAELHKCLKGYDTKGFEWYCPDNWVPHCSLATTGADEESAFYEASNLLLREFKKISGEFVSIGLVEISCPVKEICTVELSR